MSNIKFKEIKPGMAIHCQTEEEAEKLFKHLDRLGYKWWSDESLLIEDTIYDRYGKNTCYFIEENKEVTYSDIGFFKSKGYEITEFSDLIEPELTAEETIRLLAHICHNSGCYSSCPIGKIRSSQSCNEFRRDNPEKVMKVLRKYKADHEKKELEVEWYWQGMIYEIGEDGWYYQIKDGAGRYDTGCECRERAEKYMENVLKKYSKTCKGSYIATVERACRLKMVD